MGKKYVSIYSALAADILIVILKFFAGVYSNSSSMISEGIHFLVDSTNEILLLYGLKEVKNRLIYYVLSAMEKNCISGHL